MEIIPAISQSKENFSNCNRDFNSQPCPQPWVKQRLCHQPSEAIHGSKEKLRMEIQDWVTQHRYDMLVAIGQAAKIGDGSRMKITYNCDRNRAPPPTS